MKTKIFTLLLAVAASVGNLYASKNVVPSDAVLADYYNPGDVCVCFFVPDTLNCNSIVLTGSFNGWSSTPTECVAVEPVEGYDGWYVTSFEPEAEPDAYRGILAKPIMLDVDGNFNWDYQIGAATAIRGGVQVLPAYPGEIDMINYGADAPNVFTVDAWKQNPCKAVYNNYTVTVINDGCGGYVVPFIVGGMTGWAFQQMQLDVAKTREYQTAVYYYSFKAAEGTPYQIVSGLMDDQGVVPAAGDSAPAWNDIAYMQKLVDDVWGRIPGEQGDNQLTHADAEIVWDLRAEDLRWARWASCPLAYLNVTCDNTKGRVIGSGQYNIYTQVTFSAVSNYGYHFVQWNDSVTDNPRSIWLSQDTTFIAEFAPNPIITYIFDSEMGTIQGPKTTATGVAAENITFEAISKYGYHFVKWNDSVTDNPRTIWLSQDTTFIAEFAKNKYTISTQSANQTWGTTAGDTTAQYLDEVEISAIPNYGYHFVRWNDGNTSNPRTVTVTTNESYTATFAKDIFSITKNAEHGSISGNSSAEYLDFVTLTVTPDYGYHFAQWSDGLKDNPRIFQITKDTTFTAEFAYDRVGTCGKDLALVWSYDPTSKVLTIGNAGSFTENMQFGVEAPNEMEELVIGNSVTAIGANAFAGIETLKKVSIGESVKTIGEQAFYNCVNIETIFNYRPTPTNAYSTAFDGVDKFECKLYVLPSSIDMYKAAAVWRDFYYTYAIGAEEATVVTNDVQVEPQDNAATLTWPTSNNAATYTIEITKDGIVFCTLTFNSNGQLTGIAFAPSREGSHHAPAAFMTANGLQFTVTGLDSGTQYGYNVTAKDANDQPVATYSGEFTTTSEGTATGVEEVSSSLQGGERGRLILRDGQIFILRGEKVYNAQGALVK